MRVNDFGQSQNFGKMGMPPPQIVGFVCDIVLASGVIVTIRFAGHALQSPILGTKKRATQKCSKVLLPKIITDDAIGCRP